MLASYFNIPLVCEWLALFAALFLLDKRTGYWRLFILYLILTIGAETTGFYMYRVLGIRTNALPFNINLVLGKTFLIWFLSLASELQKEKNKIRITAMLFFCFGLINLLFIQGPNIYNSYSDSTGSFIIAILCGYLLLKIVQAPAYIDLLNYNFFWLASGVLLYSMSSAILYQFSGLFDEFQKREKIEIGNYINFSLNFILFSSLITAFVCSRKATRH